VSGTTTTNGIVNNGNITTTSLNSGSATIGTLAVSGATTTNGITNTGNIATATLNTTGLATLNSAAIANDASVGGALTVSGATTLQGPTQVNNSINIDTNGAAANVSKTTATLAVANGGTSMGVVGGGNVSTTASTAQVSSGANKVTVYDTARSTEVGINTVNYGTAVEGGMLVTGDLGVNGNIYSLNPTANATVNVANNGISITGATNTVNLVSDNNAVSSDGRAQVALTPEAASLTVTNPQGNVHGIQVNGVETRVSGGVNSTSMTLTNSGARFRNDTTGGPARVTGVADGRSRYDAVNYSQLRNAYAGIAQVAAMASIPEPMPNKNYSVGIGYGHYADTGGIALGLKARVAEKVSLSAAFGTGEGGENSASAGVGYSW